MVEPPGQGGMPPADLGKNAPAYPTSNERLENEVLQQWIGNFDDQRQHPIRRLLLELRERRSADETAGCRIGVMLCVHCGKENRVAVEPSEIRRAQEALGDPREGVGPSHEKAKARRYSDCPNCGKPHKPGQCPYLEKG